MKLRGGQRVELSAPTSTLKEIGRICGNPFSFAGNSLSCNEPGWAQTPDLILYNGKIFTSNTGAALGRSPGDPRRAGGSSRYEPLDPKTGGR
jgi:hypothetical protein